jgi:pimeloyl-ACP methyl ester carboxylesterase
VFLEVNSHSIYVEQRGPLDGPAVILLHHGLGAVPSWKQQAAVLAGTGFRTIVYDRWGYGRSDPRPSLSQPSFNSDVEDLLALLDELKIEQAHLVGHSDGGTIALYFAAQNPSRVMRIAVVAAHVYVEDKMETGIRQVGDSYRRDERFREGLRRLHGEKVDSVFYNWYDGWVNEENLGWDMRPVLAGIQAKVLVVQGSNDEHATIQHARDLFESLPQAELWLVPSGSHMVPQEMAEIFTQRLLNFLQCT